MFDIKEMVVETDNDGKVYLKVLMDINCYFYNARVNDGVGDVDYSAPHNNGGAYLDRLRLLSTSTPSLAEKTVGSVAYEGRSL